MLSTSRFDGRTLTVMGILAVLALILLSNPALASEGQGGLTAL